jgi:hypothetical protein
MVISSLATYCIMIFTGAKVERQVIVYKEQIISTTASSDSSLPDLPS